LTEPKAVAAVEPNPEPSITLAAFLDEYVATGITRKGEVAGSNTLKNCSVTRDLMLEGFDRSRPIDSFAVADGKAFWKWMERREIPKTKRSPTGRQAETSIRQRVGNAKAMFSHAVLEELLPQNPFRNQVSSLRASEDGKQNIPAEIIDNVIEAAPTTEWKLLVAVWRYCGLRRMEPMESTWNDVLCAEGKLRVRSSKTRHHAGKDIRRVPIRDVESYLSDAFATAAKGQLHLFPSIRSTDLLHRFLSIVEDAGYNPWPNLIKNLRLSCENYWIDAGEAPAHVIAAWIGHSVTVQNNAYANVSDGHFEQFNVRKKATPKSGNTGGNKPIRIDAYRDESELLPILIRDGKH
jgi:integrase